MRLKSASIWLRARQLLADLYGNTSGMGALEFALIVPIMMTAYFGLVEYSSAVAAKRKVILVARTLSDLTSQSISVGDSDLKNFFTASSGILTPYAVDATQPTISEIYVNASKVAKIQWSASATVALGSDGSPVATLKPSSRSPGDVVTIPANLAVAGTYLIWGEVKYQYKPTIGYVMGKTGVPLDDATFTRPRQAKCVDYPAPVAPAVACTALP